MLPLEKQDRYRRRYKEFNPNYRTSVEVYESWLAQLVHEKVRLLDAGCGPGGLVKRYEAVSSFLCGIDLEVYNQSQESKLTNIVVGDLEYLPFQSAFFDLISCSWVLEHLMEPLRVFKEFHRVLKPGGKLLILGPNAWNPVTWINRLIPSMLRPKLVKHVYGRHEEHAFPLAYKANTRKSLTSQLQRSGFQCERFVFIGDPSYLAFNEFLFRLGALFERATDIKPLSFLKVHIVALFVKEEMGNNNRYSSEKPERVPQKAASSGGFFA